MQMDIIQYIYKKHDLNIPIKWIGRKYHNTPEILKKKIQDLINENQDKDEIILSYGLCGNAVVGLKSEHTKLILPKYDDCICQQLQTGSAHKNSKEKGCMYLTREWTLDEEGIVQQCDMIYEQYGEEAENIINTIYGGYHSVVVIDTGAYDVHKLDNYVDNVEKLTGMKLKYKKGSGKVLENILTGNYKENKDILLILPKQEITIWHFKEISHSYTGYT